MSSVFKIGDLVQFDASYILGVVVDTKRSDDLSEADNEIYDILVYWIDGETFWCMDFTLQHLSDVPNYL